jgi:uncharacterized protein YbjT (DUF2867 family)
MGQNLIVVTGGTGNIGAKLVPLLLEKGARVRAVGRQAQRLKFLSDKGAEVFVADLQDKAAAARAFAGAAAVFAMIPPNYGAPDFRAYQERVGEALAEGVRSAGVPRVAHLSSLGAELASGTGPIAGLHDSEERFNALNVHVVHLRPAYFMENHLSTLGLVKDRGMNGGGLRPDLPLAMIAARDIAARAADLLDSSFAGKSVLELLGPRDYTMAEATRALGAAIGRKELPYVQVPFPELEKALLGMGFSADAARLFTEMSDAHNQGRIRPGRPRGPKTATPTTLEQFAAAVYAPAFQRN